MKSNVVIRPFDFSDADYASVLRIYMANFPDEPTSAETWRFQDEKRDKSKLFSRNIVQVDGKHVGTVWFGKVTWIDDPGLYFLGGSVHPDYQRRGLGRMMYDYVMEQLAPYNPTGLHTSARADKTDAVNMLEKRGFVVAMKQSASALTVSEFDLNQYAALTQKMANQGIRIRSLEEIQQTDPAWQENMYTLKWALLHDVPMVEPLKQPPLAEWVEKQFEHPGFGADAWFVAEDMTSAEQPCYVGLSHLYRNQATDERLEVGLTGVLPDYRRRGIATALKVRTVEFSTAYGAKEIWTDNAEDNPMYQLNLVLGFRPKPGMLIYNKTLSGKES